MQINWTDIVNVVLQLITAYMTARNHRKIERLHQCVDGAKKTADFHTDIVVDLLKDIKNSVNRSK